MFFFLNHFRLLQTCQFLTKQLSASLHTIAYLTSNLTRLRNDAKCKLSFVQVQFSFLRGSGRYKQTITPMTIIYFMHGHKSQSV